MTSSVHPHFHLRNNSVNFGGGGGGEKFAVQGIG
jgi:hypothetical protein